MVQKKRLGIILRKLMNLEYGNDNIREIENTLKKIEFKKVKLPNYVKKKLIDHWVIDKYDDGIMPSYSYVIDPIDDIDILIKLEEKNYLAFNLVENRGHYPIYKKRVTKEYIYVIILEKRAESIFYNGKYILKDIEINAVLDFYNDILEMKNRLDNSIRNMNCKIEISLEDKVVSSFEYGRTGWCIETVNNIYDNLIRKRIDFDNLLND